MTEDSTTPANNKGLPSLAMIYKNGVQVPVSDSDSNPNDVVAVPVKITDVGGTAINITAGDINVQTSDMGVNFDSQRIGDGSGVYLKIEADGSIKAIVDQSVAEGKLDSIKAVLDPINGKDFATEAKLEAVRLLIASLDGKNFATETTLSSVNTKLNSLATTTGQAAIVAAIQNIVFDKTGLATIAKQDDLLLKLTEIDLILDNSLTKQTEIDTVLGASLSKQTEIDTVLDNSLLKQTEIGNAIDAMSLKLPASLGAKTGANSLSIVPASDAGMATSALQTVANSLLASLVGGTLLLVETSIVNNVTPEYFTPPIGAKKMILINNPANNAAAIRWVEAAQTPTAANGAILIPSAQTPLLPASSIGFLATEGSADVSVAWFG